MLTSSGKVPAPIQAGYQGEINQLFFGVLDPTAEHNQALHKRDVFAREQERGGSA